MNIRSIRIFLLIGFLFAFVSNGYSSIDSLLADIETLKELDYPERGEQILMAVKNPKIGTDSRIKIINKELDDIAGLKGQEEFQVKYLLKLAGLYNLRGRLTKSSETVLRCRELIQSLNDGNRKWKKYLADTKLHLAECYYRQNSNDDAITTLQDAISGYEAIQETDKLDKFYTQLGVYYSEKGHSDSALVYYEKALPIAIDQKDTSQILRIEFCKAADYSLLEEWEPVKAILTRILPELKKRNHSNITNSISILGDAELNLGNRELAKMYYDSAYNMVNRLGDKNGLTINCPKLVKYYKEEGDYKSALFYSEKYETTMSDLFGQFLQDKRIAAQEKYETLEKEQQIRALKLEGEVAASKFKNLLTLLIGGFLLILGAIFFWLNRQRQKQRENFLLSKKEIETQEVRQKLLTSITHELRTPLSLIIGKLESLQQAGLKSNDKSQVDTAHRNAQQLIEQINQLLEWNQLESKSLENIPSLGDAKIIFQQALENVKCTAEKKNINWQVNIEQASYVGQLDFEKYKTIISNLMSNAAKYSPMNGKITVDLTHSNDQLEFLIQDEGPGIPEAQLDKIFNWYYRIANSGDRQDYEGFGIGLALSKELAELLGGKLIVNSKMGEGSVFKFQVPLMTSDQASAVLDNAALEENSLASLSVDKPEAPTMLILEDHPELAEHIKSLFEADFETHIAYTIESGKKIVESLIPDLIISDIMLPDGSGLDFCKIVKSRMLTDHIPIVMLTAKTDETTRLKGLEFRADAFLTKPCKNEELILTVQNLLQNRRILQLRYSGIVSKTDEKVDPFTEKLLEVLEENYQDQKFNVAAFAHALNVGRGQLYKKMRSTLDNTPTTVLRNYRLEKAKGLVEKNNKTIAEIAYECGFTSPEYFSTVFKEYYKLSPSEMKAKTS